MVVLALFSFGIISLYNSSKMLIYNFNSCHQISLKVVFNQPTSHYTSLKLGIHLFTLSSLIEMFSFRFPFLIKN